MAKKLLKENTVRRFMKLASLGGLSSEFINENFDEELEEGMYGAPDAHEKDEMEEGMHDAAMAHPADAHEEDEMPMGDEMPMDDEPLEAEEAPADDSPEDMARKAIEAVAAALGVEIDIASDAGEEAEELDLPAEEPLDEPAEELEEKFGAAAADAANAMKDAASALGLTDDEELEEVAEPVNEEEEITESVMSLLDKADIEVVDDEALREGLVKKVAARVIKRLIKDQA